MRFILVGLSILLLAKQAVAQSKCYFANGTPLPYNDDAFNDYQPCFGVGGICCGLNRRNPSGGYERDGWTVDECLPNGLCQNRVINDDGALATTWWVEYCTDSNITSGNCLNVCDQVRTGAGTSELTPCDGRADSERWCCGNSTACCGNSTACCGTNIGVVRLAPIFGGLLSSRIAGSSTTETASPTKSSTSATVSTSGTGTTSSFPSPSTVNSGLSDGAIAGIVIGAVAGVTLLAAVIFFWKRSAKYKEQASMPHYAEVPGSGYPGGNQYTQQQAGPIELPPAAPSEMPSGEYAEQYPQR
ncbi:hypothetical protein IQ07DRAFT_571266 [Pyrenochaeta sp. DS3sAY3a]|nr:hypothetical protein IQ07DRAFT_571266 [Pyrenochaeta sp. DS3sAY3a]